MTFLMCLFPFSEAYAQNTQRVAKDFSGLHGGRTIAVIDDSGKETSGRLLRFPSDSLTMAAAPTHGVVMCTGGKRIGAVARGSD